MISVGKLFQCSVTLAVKKKKGEYSQSGGSSPRAVFFLLQYLKFCLRVEVAALLYWVQ